MNGLEYLAQKAVEESKELEGPFVFDGIRSDKEVEYLRQQFPNFFLITVYAPKNVRWERVSNEYEGHQREFHDNDSRDSGEDLDYGQKVQLCVDQADVVITNTENHATRSAGKILLGKFNQYLKLLEEEELRSPTQDETNMATAYAFSLRSLCIKRQVGAVITDKKGNLLTTGFNENPDPMPPCIKKFGFCYKDQWLMEHLQEMIDKRNQCVYCRENLTSIEQLEEGTKCPHCHVNLLKAYSPDRGMTRCTAIHAEQMAILNAAGRDLADGTLYTTTYPCLQCAKQICYTGIKKVVYIEHYPDPDSEKFLRDFTGIEVKMFEGIKARAFDKVFSRLRSTNEKIFQLH